jgi:hypothetical protein
MPTRFWRYQARNLDEAEMDVITVRTFRFLVSALILTSPAERRRPGLILSRPIMPIPVVAHNTLPSAAQSFSAYASRCCSTSSTLMTLHLPRTFGSSASALDTIPISTSPALYSVACTVAIASIAICPQHSVSSASAVTARAPR